MKKNLQYHIHIIGKPSKHQSLEKRTDYSDMTTAKTTTTKKNPHNNDHQDGKFRIGQAKSELNTEKNDK